VTFSTQLRSIEETPVDDASDGIDGSDVTVEALSRGLNPPAGDSVDYVGRVTRS